MIYIRALGGFRSLYKGPGKTYTTHVSLTVVDAQEHHTQPMDL